MLKTLNLVPLRAIILSRVSAAGTRSQILTNLWGAYPIPCYIYARPCRGTWLLYPVVCGASFAEGGYQARRMKSRPSPAMRGLVTALDTTRTLLVSVRISVDVINLGELSAPRLAHVSPAALWW